MKYLRAIPFTLYILTVLALFINQALAAPNDYYQTDFTIDALVGNDVIDFSPRMDKTMIVWSPAFNLAGFHHCYAASYKMDGMPAMSLTCARVEADHVSRTITAMCLPQTIDQAQDQMDLVGDDSANHVLFTIKCRTKLIQQAHKS